MKNLEKVYCSCINRTWGFSVVGIFNTPEQAINLLEPRITNALESTTLYVPEVRINESIPEEQPVKIIHAKGGSYPSHIPKLDSLLGYEYNKKKGSIIWSAEGTKKERIPDKFPGHSNLF